MKYTKSQKIAREKILLGKDIFITGKPGTGKTELIRNICAEQRALGKKVLVTASTGLAASNMEFGQTLHSVLNWKINVKEYSGYFYKYCALALNEADLLIVDEASMLSYSILKHLYSCLLFCENRPQIIIIGDFFQLPPVWQNNRGLYPFETFYWKDLNLSPVILNEVVRQTDPVFKQQLDYARLADTRCIPYFQTATQQNKIEHAIELCTKNGFADFTNAIERSKLPGKEFRYLARGKIEDVNFGKIRIERELCVKENMRVMALYNQPQGLYHNGSLGTVVGFDDKCIIVHFDNGKTTHIPRIRYNLENKRTGALVEIEQFPLRGGYAITIHKSQGQTFEAVNINAPNCWAPGQMYVALSRARSVQGIHLVRKLKEEDFITDARVVNYYRSLECC